MPKPSNVACNCGANVKVLDYSPTELKCTNCNLVFDKINFDKTSDKPILSMYRDDFEAKYCGKCSIACRYKGCYDFRYIKEGPMSFKIPERRKNKGMGYDNFVSAITHYPVIPIMFALMSRKEEWFKAIKKLSDSVFLEKLYSLYIKVHADAELLEKMMREAWWEKEGKHNSVFSAFRERIHRPVIVING